MMNPDKYPNLSFTLDNGRRVKVNAFVWEPSYDETVEVQSGEEFRELTVERKRLRTEELFGNRSVHFIGPEYVDKYQHHPPRIPNTSVTVWLSSTPMSEEAVYSELIVIFFVDFVDGSSLESILKLGLHDLDWEKHAGDTTEKTVELWKEAWLIRTVH